MTAAVSNTAPTPTAPTRGTLGSLDAQTFLTSLASQAVSGTLYLSRAGASVLLTLQNGQPRLRTDFGDADSATFDLSVTDAQFGLWFCPEVYLPALPNRYPVTGPLWALPALTEHTLLSTAETGLRGLVARLTADAFTGALVLETPGAANAPGTDHPDTPTRGLLLFQAGRLGGAACEGGVRAQGSSAALRSLIQFAGASLTLHALPDPVVAGLLGWLLGLQLSDTPGAAGVPEGFSGLELFPEGARYYHAGSAYLQLPRPANVPADPSTLGLFAACQRAPSLALPGEPHGWEGRRYGLTLRGRDALNPMTELAMRFRSDFGPAGRRTLEGFRREPSAEAVAEMLELALDELKGIVEQLEQGGFVRSVGDAAPERVVSDVSLTPRLQPR